MTFGKSGWPRPTIAGLKISIAAPNRGRLHVQCILRGFSNSAIEEVIGEAATTIDEGMSKLEVAFAKPIGVNGDLARFSVESWFVWLGDRPLALDAVPGAITMTAIIVKDLSDDIPIFDVASSSIRQLLLRRAVGGQVAQQGSHVVVNALKNIGFEAHDGDRIGLVGPNGAGKTTLLRVLADIYPPTSGTVEVVGRVSPMFDNNLGMNADATGLENVRLCGLLWVSCPRKSRTASTISRNSPSWAAT